MLNLILLDHLFDVLQGTRLFGSLGRRGLQVAVKVTADNADVDEFGATIVRSLSQVKVQRCLWIFVVSRLQYATHLFFYSIPRHDARRLNKDRLCLG